MGIYWVIVSIPTVVYHGRDSLGVCAGPREDSDPAAEITALSAGQPTARVAAD